MLGRNKAFLLIMAIGSICGAFVGRYLPGIVPALAAILLISAYKVRRHKQTTGSLPAEYGFGAGERACQSHDGEERDNGYCAE